MRGAGDVRDGSYLGPAVGDDRKSALVSGIEQAQEALGQLDKQQRKQQQADLRRLEGGLAFARLTVEGTQGELLAEGVRSELIALLGEIANNPQQAAANPAGFHDRLMQSLSGLPATQGRDLEQEAKGAASSFRRSTSQHLRRINEEVDELRGTVSTAQSDLQETAEQTTVHIGEARSALDARLNEIDAAAATARQQIEQQVVSHENAFEEERDQRSQAAQSQWGELRDQIKGQTKDLVADVERMRDEVKETVGAVGAATTANHYGQVAKRERKSYLSLLAVTVLALVLAVVIAANAAGRGELDVARFLSKLSVSLVLGALAAFTATRARDHRSAEKRASDMEVELRVFGPFTENLPEPERTIERRVMTRRIFGRSSGPPPEEGEEPAIEETEPPPE